MSNFVKDSVLGQIRGENDGGDRTWGRVQLPAAPAGTKRMKLGFKVYFDTFGTASSTAWYGIDSGTTAWDTAGFFGLGFDNTIHADGNDFNGPFNVPADFLGVTTYGSPYSWDSAYYTYYRTGYGVDLGGMSGTNRSFVKFFGRNASSSPYTGHLGGFANGIGGSMISDGATLEWSDATWLLGFPANPTDGAAFSGLWEIWADELDLTMRARLAYSFAGLSGEGMLDTVANAATATATSYLLNRTYEIHGNTTSTFRPSLETVVFPRWLKFAWPWKAQKFVIDDYVVQYEQA